MASQSASFFYSHLIVKRGGVDKPIPWHQDLPYWKLDGSQIASVWVALDAMPAEASVRYLRGSHRWGMFKPQHFADARPYSGREELPALPNIEAMVASGEAEALTFAVSPGDAVCFDARVVHGSPGNPEQHGNDHRRVALRFGGDDAVYNDLTGESAIPTPEVSSECWPVYGRAIAIESCHPRGTWRGSPGRTHTAGMEGRCTAWIATRATFSVRRVPPGVDNCAHMTYNELGLCDGALVSAS
jgi:hypothetical protein